MSGATVFLRTTGTAPAGAPVAQRLDACVRNTGNYFFEESLLRQLPGVQVCNGLDALPRQISTLVLSMSNFISPTTDLGYLHDALHRRRIGQVVMVGAGAQAYDYGDSIRLTEGTRRFLHYVADHSRTIGVRGCYTADVLRRLGIRNVDVIGCPSAFWAGSAPRLHSDALPVHPRVAVHSTPVGHYRDKVSALMAHGMRHGADYIMQSEAWMMPLLGAGGDPALLRENLLFYAHPECDPARLQSWLQGHVRVFFGMEQWLGHIGGYDFVYGSRFHGNMAAIQAGVPALNMPFDTRTRELCEHLNLPMLPLAEFHAGIPLERLRELADFTLYERTYPDRLGRYAAFLSRNGVAHGLDQPGLDQPGAASALPPTAGWAARLASVRQLLADLDAAGGCSAAVLQAAMGHRLRCDRDGMGRTAAEEGRLADISPGPAPSPVVRDNIPMPEVAVHDAWAGLATAVAPDRHWANPGVAAAKDFALRNVCGPAPALAAPEVTVRADAVPPSFAKPSKHRAPRPVLGAQRTSRPSLAPDGPRA